ncbi:hypothetical protein M422DRAFT_38114 [Sphaerobolus stellatus SS14]|uniref:Unplaced genomic scaffold SPHSTscaffold_284, whole genome shotgun sequence n=1 Tax=Sphaerobolus stellatus (strain SS14) TaxID=990650 RepID=A0A0C9UC78_SPHS4|nr:hypothetical protein M422DRAFT_38114 [Sphaerobolus stellatus SS14]
MEHSSLMCRLLVSNICVTSDQASSSAQCTFNRSLFHRLPNYYQILSFLIDDIFTHSKTYIPQTLHIRRNSSKPLAHEYSLNLLQYSSS